VIEFRNILILKLFIIVDLIHYNTTL